MALILVGGDRNLLLELMSPTGGLFRIVPMMRGELLATIEAAQTGDPVSTILVTAIYAAHRQIEDPPHGSASMGCVACHNALAGRLRSYAVAVSDPPLVGRAFAMPLCEACAPDPAAIVAAAHAFLRWMWPKMRNLPACAFAEGGRA